MTDEQYMRLALTQAKNAFDEGEVPMGAIIVLKNQIIARAYNQVEKLTDSTAHAEMIALTAAYNYLGAKYLPDATLFVTLQPCLMCSGALYWSKIGRVVYGATDEKHGYSKVLSNHTNKREGEGGIFHPKTIVVSGVLQAESGQLMKDFFRKKR